MSDLKMGTAEARFADIIWEREPITSGQMAKIGAEEFNWKKSTSHTVLRRLCERGLFKNEDGTVTSLISREEYYARHSEQYVEETFGGSLPAFLAAFGTRKKLTDQEIDELQKENDEYTTADVIGKSGIEQYMETTLRGHNGSETLFVNNTGKVIEISERTEPTAGNDVYLKSEAKRS